MPDLAFNVVTPAHIVFLYTLPPHYDHWFEGTFTVHKLTRFLFKLLLLDTPVGSMRVQVIKGVCTVRDL